MLQDIEVMRPDGSSYTLHYDTGILNRLDRPATLPFRH